MGIIENTGEKVNFKQQQDEVSQIISNPFKQDNIVGIHLHYHKVKNFFGVEKFTVYNRGTVEFQNGDTKGEQTIEADSFPELIRLVFEFCNKI